MFSRVSVPLLCLLAVICICTDVAVGECLSEQQYRTECTDVFLPWMLNHDVANICSNTGLTAFSCIKEHIEPRSPNICNVRNDTVQSQYERLFAGYFYNVQFFCEYNTGSTCHLIPGLFEDLQTFTNTDGRLLGFYNFFCGPDLLFYILTTLTSFIPECPVSVEIYRSNSLQITTSEAGIINTDILERTLLVECAKLLDADISCIEEHQSELESTCQVHPVIDVPAGQIFCNLTNQSGACIEGICGSAVSNFYADMFNFLQCGMPDPACSTTSDRHGTWPVTKVGQTARLTCNGDYMGLRSRECSQNGVWEDIQGECKLNYEDVIQDIEDEVNRLKNASVDELPEMIERLSEKTSNVTNEDDFGESWERLKDMVEVTKDIVEVMEDEHIITDKASDAIIETLSNILKEEHQDGWNMLHEKDADGAGTAPEVAGMVDTYLGVLQEAKCNGLRSGTSTQTYKDNLYVEVGREISSSVTFPRNQAVGSSSIQISSEALTNKNMVDACFGGAYYPTISTFIHGGLYINSTVQDAGAELIVNSDVISLQLQGVDDGYPKDIDPPVRITLTLKQRNHNGHPICVFWDYDLGSTGSNGAWSTDGCTLVNTTNTHVICQCKHLTNFAILMSPIQSDSEHMKILGIISIVGCAISILCLVLTMLIHCGVWRSVRSDRAIILMNLCVALLAALVIFLAGVNRTDNKDVCTAIAALIQFFFLVVFFVMLLIGIEILICVVHVFATRFRVKFFIPAAWIIPMIIVGISLWQTELDGFGNERFCWLETSSGLIWAFIGPAALIILVNFIILIVVLKKMAFVLNKTKAKTTQMKVQAGIRSMCVLLPTMGLAWMFGLLAVNNDLIVFQYLFAIFNSLQGLFIFLFHCVLNKQIRDALSRRQARKRSEATLSSDLRKRQQKNDSSNKSSSSAHKTGARRIRNDSNSYSTSSRSSVDEGSYQGYDWERIQRREYHHNLRISNTNNTYI